MSEDSQDVQDVQDVDMIAYTTHEVGHKVMSQHEVNHGMIEEVPKCNCDEIHFKHFGDTYFGMFLGGAIFLWAFGSMMQKLEKYL